MALNDLRREVLILHHKRRITYAYLDVAHILMGNKVLDENSDAEAASDLDDARKGFDAELQEIQEASPDALLVIRERMAADLANFNLRASAYIVSRELPDFPSFGE